MQGELLNADLEAPTVAMAAQVVYEGLALSAPPQEILRAIVAQRFNPRWGELSQASRDWLTELLRDACVPAAFIGGEVDPDARITVRPTHPAAGAATEGADDA